eukprot:scaffold5637_cov121-Isochrysis_galbana.AAC.4
MTTSVSRSTQPSARRRDRVSCADDGGGGAAMSEGCGCPSSVAYSAMPTLTSKWSEVRKYSVGSIPVEGAAANTAGSMAHVAVERIGAEALQLESLRAASDGGESRLHRRRLRKAAADHRNLLRVLSEVRVLAKQLCLCRCHRCGHGGDGRANKARPASSGDEERIAADELPRPHHHRQLDRQQRHLDQRLGQRLVEFDGRGTEGARIGSTHVDGTAARGVGSTPGCDGERKRQAPKRLLAVNRRPAGRIAGCSSQTLVQCVLQLITQAERRLLARVFLQCGRGGGGHCPNCVSELALEELIPFPFGEERAEDTDLGGHLRSAAYVRGSTSPV